MKHKKAKTKKYKVKVESFEAIVGKIKLSFPDGVATGGKVLLDDKELDGISELRFQLKAGEPIKVVFTQLAHRPLFKESK